MTQLFFQLHVFDSSAKIPPRQLNSEPSTDFSASCDKLGCLRSTEPLMGPSDNNTLNLILSYGAGDNGGTPNGLNYPSDYTIDYVH